MKTMPLSLALDGEIPLEAFTAAVASFRQLVDGLTREASTAADVRWLVDPMIGAGTQITIWATACSPDEAGKVATALLDVGRSLADGEAVRVPSRVKPATDELAALLHRGIRSLRFETADDDVVIHGPQVGRTELTFGRSLLGAYGSVQGRVVASAGDCPVRFLLLDHLDRGPIAGYLREDQRALLRGALDRRAVVEGWVNADGASDRPLTVRRITGVELLDDVPRGFLLMKARGILPAMPGEPPPEVRVRQMRDSWDG